MYLEKPMVLSDAEALELKNAVNKSDKFSVWAMVLKERRGFNKACVAIANKLARMAWVILHRGERYKVPVLPN